MPDLIHRLENYALLNLPQEALNVSLYASLYWRGFAYGLIILFLLHFAVRALWIGMIGLNSVYPDGFTPNEMSSRDLQEKMRAEYGDVDGLINRLDRSASGMFGNGFAIAGVFLNIGLVLLVGIVLYSLLLRFYLPENLFVIVAVGLIATIMLLGVLNTVLSLPSMREREWVKRWHFPILMFSNRMTYLVNHHYTVTGMNLVVSAKAAKQKTRSPLRMIGLGIVVSSVGGILIATTLRLEFYEHYYARTADDASLVYPCRYADRMGDCDKLLYGPVVPTYVWAEAPTLLPVWVPLPEREIRYLEDNCSVPAVDYEAETGPERHVRRRDRRRRFLDCAREHITVSINGTVQEVRSLRRAYRSSNDSEQFGVELLLERPELQPGDNVLHVATRFESEDYGNQRDARLPIYVGPSLDN